MAATIVQGQADALAGAGDAPVEQAGRIEGERSLAADVDGHRGTESRICRAART
ncbi:hypothetical protein [Embleya sp. NPDC020630]|uniref:hypothetical protein n=1 Tax=Embleya sp. NPDC020630 TaxID=3363979 RepID=UPI00379B64F8